MSDRCARIVLLLALMPLVFGTWVLMPASAGGRLQPGSITGTVIALVVTVVIWRRYVRWTALRSLSTAGLVLLALGQVVIWHPLWAMGGCGMDQYLCTSQTLSAGGLTLGALALIWWAGLLTRRDQRNSEFSPRRALMTPNAVRLAIGIALLPFLPGLFFVEYFALEKLGWGWSSDLCVWVCYETCTVVAVAVWLLLWRRAVVWDRTRWLVSLGLAALLLASPVSVFWENAFGQGVFGQMCGTFCLSSPLFAFALWLAGTAWLWRNRQPHALAERLAGIGAEDIARCPTCGYNLHGLREVRCPECGWASTVDDIVQRSLADTLAVP